VGWPLYLITEMVAPVTNHAFFAHRSVLFPWRGPMVDSSKPRGVQGRVKSGYIVDTMRFDANRGDDTA
jgi:hypothetical protein